MKLKNKIILTGIIPLILLTVIFGSIAIISMRKLALNSTYDGLNSTALSMRQYLLSLSSEEYSVKENDLYKGPINISNQTEFVDTVAKESNVNITVFYGKVRYLTSLRTESGQRAIGTEVSDSVYKSVMEEGKTYYSPDTDIEGSSYVSCYVPIIEDNNIVGMVFVGKSHDIVYSSFQNVQKVFAILTVIILIISIFVIVAIATTTVKRIKLGINVVEKIADGDLTVKIKKSALKSKDETGDIARAVVKLRNQLNDIVSSIVKHSDALRAESETLSANATRTLDTVSQVDYAVNEIANGATNQAEETQNATTAVLDMGELISKTADETERLADISNNMLVSSEEVLNNLSELENVNKQAQNAIDEIYVQTHTTNESAIKIQEATHLITSIAEETNLLALNASIEAARAGEAGKGFAVVASEIQKLSEQSNESANQINEIIDSLIEDSNTAVETMNNVKEVMNVQSESVSRTNELFATMQNNMNASISSIKTISKHAQIIDKSRLTVVDAVQDLSAIAQENAASTEETSASITEVKELTEYIGERAERLDSVSSDLSEAMKIFIVN